ncbi:SpoIID/LytB domain-containing protein [Prochlorococcus marinus]|uniref:SpoIID/LytB domain-containing protein n=1 Tax=Prochlorococcus marinus TaxID=1219 RepID=UPI0003253590|nr:SpoIID/LytB domain-containing protein [Prochlorococcus marinus]
MIRTLIPRISLVFGCFLLAQGIFDRSKANNLLEPNIVHSTHEQIEAPRSIISANGDLLVGLEPYLGRSLLQDIPSPDLNLISGGKKPLILKDQSGLVHKSVDITIGWEKVPLKTLKTFSRQVLGPFASFESAQSVSALLDDQGVENIIAHPLDWEIWIAADINLPKSFQARSFEEKISHEIKPFLKVRNAKFFLNGNSTIDAAEGLRWKGGLYSGSFILQKDAYQSWTLVERVDLEKYLLGVVPHEIGSSSPLSALSAQAVLARTWALANSKRFEIDGYHLCSNTQCQVYKDPQKAEIEVQEAIKKTSGKVLTWEGTPINAVYHATNGGVMASANEAWSIDSVPYLQTQFDGSKRWSKQFALPLNQKSMIQTLLAKRDGAYGNNHYLFRWRRKISASELQEALLPLRKKFGRPQKLQILERGPSGRVIALEISGRRNESPIILRRDAIRRRLRSLPSTLFWLRKLKEGGWEFIGGGFGHGAGLSQAGATDLALRGWSTQNILKHYYPGTTYESLR